MPEPARAAPSARIGIGLLVLAFVVVGVGAFALLGLPRGTAAPSPSPTSVGPSAPIGSSTPSASASASATPAPTATPTLPPPTATPAATPDEATLRRWLGERLVVRMDDPQPSKALLDRVARGEVAGICLFAFNVVDRDQLRRAIASLQAAAAKGGQPPLLIMVDQEGGGIRRIPWAPPDASASAMGLSGDATGIEAIGRDTGQALAESGINVDLAPVLDVASEGSFMAADGRTFGSDPGVVGELGSAFARGLTDGGVLPTIKHFPGIGRVERNTDRYVQTVDATREDLFTDVAPFRVAIDDGAPLVMLSNATYTAYDPDDAAGWSPEIANTVLRDELGFAGVTITDSLNGTAKSRGTTSTALAERAAAAGVDLLLLTGAESSTAATFKHLLALAKDGTLDPASLEASYDRVVALKGRLDEEGRVVR